MSNVINSELTAIGNLTCSQNEIIKRKADGTGWECNDMNTVINSELTAIGDLTCGQNEIIKRKAMGLGGNRNVI